MRGGSDGKHVSPFRPATRWAARLTGRLFLDWYIRVDASEPAASPHGGWSSTLNGVQRVGLCTRGVGTDGDARQSPPVGGDDPQTGRQRCCPRDSSLRRHHRRARRAVTTAAEELVETAEREFEAAEGVELAAIEDEIRNNQDPFDVARLILQWLRMSRAPRTYRRLGQGFGDIGTILGYVRAETGEFDVASLGQVVTETRTEVSSLRDDFDYRLAAPVQKQLPTVVAAERALVYAETELKDTGQAVERLDRATDPKSAAVGRAWGQLEQTRLATRNAAIFLATATESAQSPRRNAIRQATETEREEAAAVKESQLTVADGAPATVRTTLGTIRSRHSDLVTATIDERQPGPKPRDCSERPRLEPKLKRPVWRWPKSRIGKTRRTLPKSGSSPRSERP